MKSIKKQRKKSW